jgi:O-antigen/teichoic acid export membrane protein
MKYFLNYGISKLFPGILNFLIIIISIRNLNIEVYGEYSYVLSLITLICSFLYPWIKINISRRYLEFKNSQNRQLFLNTTNTLFLISTIVYSLIVFALILYHDSNHLLILFGAIALLVQSYFEQVTTFLRADLKSTSYMKHNIIRSIVRFISFVVLFFIIDLEAYSLFIALFVGNVLPFLLSKSFNQYKHNNININIEQAKSFLSYGIPLMISSLMVYIINSSDRIFIERYLGSEELGKYSAIYDTVGFLFTTFFIIVNMAFYPLLFKTFGRDISAFKLISKNFTKINILVPVALMLPLILYNREFSKYILRKSFELDLLFLLILIGIVISGFKSYLIDTNFHIIKRTKLQTITVIIAASSNLLLNFLLIPRFGVNGAAWSTIISVLIGMILSIYLIWRTKSNQLFFEYGRIVVGILLFLVLAILIKAISQVLIPIDIVSVLSSIIIYFILVILSLVYIIDYKSLIIHTKRDE